MSGDRGEGARILLACDFHRHYCAMLAGALDRQAADVTMVTRDHDLEFGGREVVDIWGALGQGIWL